MRELRTWALRVMVIGALPAGLGSGCADHESAEAEGAYVSPPGFSATHTRAAVLSGFAFARDASQQIVTNTVISRREIRQAKGLPELARSDDNRDELKLEAVFHGTYADGMSVAVSGQPNAWLRVKPQGAQASRGRVRGDGSLVSFDEAFPKVTSAFGGNERKVEEFLVIQKEEDAPQLAYDLEPGPDFARLEEGDGRLWAFARDGSGLFTINPPFADDAAGKHVVGTWQLSEKPAGGYTITAKIELKGLQYPVLLDPTFETPTWFKSTSGQPTGFAAGAGAFDPHSNCSVIFGGASGPTFTPLNQTHVRCADQTWGANISTSNTPAARAYAAAASDGSVVNVFGGFTATAPTDELWQLTVSTSGGSSSRTGSWSQVTKSGSWPPARYLHGAAWSGSKLVIFGGVDGAGNGLRDTWEWNGSTWTQICASCFGGSAGLYGFASGATVTGGGTRTIYAMGGYDNPTGASGNFTNSVYQYTGSGWVNVDGDNAVVPVNAQGVLQNGTQLAPQGRYLHWIAGTAGGNLLIGSGLTTAASGTDSFFTDTWLWYNQATTGISNQWQRAPLPTNAGSGPGNRESSVAIYDESLKQVVLFGGSTDSSGTTTNSGLVYKGASRTFGLTLDCALGDCSSFKYTLTATFPGLTNATTPSCGNMLAAFVQFDGTTGQWSPVAKADGTPASPVTATFSNGVCSAAFTTPNAIDNTTITNMGARVRDSRYHAAGTTCASAAGEVSTGGLPGCLSASGTDGNASCGDGSVPSLDGVFLSSITCENY